VSEAGLEAILVLERRLHPRMEERDVFKLVSQAVFGGDHLLRDQVMFEKGLSTEWGSLEPGSAPGCPVLQVIDPAGRTARVHLVPLLETGIELHDLIGFLAGQPLKRGSMEDFRRIWKQVPSIVGPWDPPMNPGLLAVMEPGATPSRHSAGYGFAAYRICNDIRSERSREWLGGRGLLQDTGPRG
jgi:hypothetical protein